MPLTSLQSDILRLLAAHRDPESYVAGSTPLIRAAPRISSDIDIFHDREDRVAAAASNDASLLEANGFALQWLRREPAFYALVARKHGAATRLEWAQDSDFRFFPTIPDALFGYILHPIDIATSKAMAAAGRREPRDIVDLLHINETILPLGAVIWAAVGRALGFTPEGLANEIRRLARYTTADFDRVASDPPIDPTQTMIRLRQALDAADAFIARMPTESAGLVFLRDGAPVLPDPAHLPDYVAHQGARRGHWPTAPEITTAMLHHQKPAEPNPT